MTECPWRVLECDYCSEPHPECQLKVNRDLISRMIEIFLTVEKQCTLIPMSCVKLEQTDWSLAKLVCSILFSVSQPLDCFTKDVSQTLHIAKIILFTGIMVGT